MAQKPSIPKGTRDFNPEQVAKRRYIFNTIQKQFERFGFQPIETPSFENSDTLMGKYGDEGDRLIFKILNSGDYLSKFTQFFNQRTIRFFEAYAFRLHNENIDVLEFLKNERASSTFYQRFFESELVGSDFKGIEIFDEKYESAIMHTIDENKDEVAILFNDIDDDFKNFDESRKLVASKLASQVFSTWLFNYDSKVSSIISEKALRYDLTVPFARYVVQHQNEIELPFKRYQIQPVWRADRPQKGRFREFYQCDADVVGSKSLWQEVEFVQLYDAVFSALGLKGTTIKINNRKILTGIAEVIGAKDKLIDFTVALDKLDKIGEEKVKDEMRSKGIPEDGISKLQPLFGISGSFKDQVAQLKPILASSEEGLKGIEELEFISEAISTLGLTSSTLQLDVTLARGLNYYTGAIFEVAAPESVSMGSIGGGGRYDDLTGIFGLKHVSGVGISFGLDRIYLVLEELNLFPETIAKSTDVLFINFGDKEALSCLKAIKILREIGVNAELYPDASKMKKQMNYANKRNIPFVVLVGEEEMITNTFTFKEMSSGIQDSVNIDQLIGKIINPS
ncbi:histidine--tRNA ligase [Ichthyenterobacterium sp. W332]|uniref:Histidine--tRNA ligase n=1 Tax=Microcosmobacter mediterraneus TaxID=3075607 RepID=A0ABU2YLR3_9FLAO|nr:histidine--tRNA ligase [Ichthyenterobacterium sp. W332]MDT0559100.1 histidine--tRNA ligase [Ichthyenterobacterium sp. W332]